MGERTSGGPRTIAKQVNFIESDARLWPATWVVHYTTLSPFHPSTFNPLQLQQGQKQQKQQQKASDDGKFV